MEDNKKTERIYERLKRALLEEPCTVSEGRNALERLRNEYFTHKAENFLDGSSLQEVAEAPTYSYEFWNGVVF